MTTAAFIVILILTLLTQSRAVEIDGGLDLDENPDIANQLQDTAIAQHYVHDVERFASLPLDYFNPVVGWSEDGEERARSHIASAGARFTLLREREEPFGTFAYSTFTFQHPRTQQWKHALMILGSRPGERGYLIGEAHFPEGLSTREVYQLWSRLNAPARWDRRDVARDVGALALHI